VRSVRLAGHPFEELRLDVVVRVGTGRPDEAVVLDLASRALGCVDEGRAGRDVLSVVVVDDFGFGLGEDVLDDGGVGRVSEDDGGPGGLEGGVLGVGVLGALLGLRWGGRFWWGREREEEKIERRRG
jgi:hypothetical protein